MKILSTNIASPQTIEWRGQKVKTGIFKKPTKDPIFLEKEAVKGDEVSDRKVHGGVYKACYLFSTVHYPYWKEKYPNLDWTWGMFGENLTVEGLNENNIVIGDIYKVGKALIQVTQPREPCFKFGVKFGTQKVLREFIAHGHSGTYVSVLEEGEVCANDALTLIERPKDSLTTAQFFNLLYAKEKDQSLLRKVIKIDTLPLRKREKLKAFLN